MLPIVAYYYSIVNKFQNTSPPMTEICASHHPPSETTQMQGQTANDLDEERQTVWIISVA